jgi:uncharacterized protein
MLKIILLAIVIWLLLKILKSYQQNLDHPSKKSTDAKSEEDMVICAKCGVHHPISDSFLVKGKHYCCAAHAKNKD